MSMFEFYFDDSRKKNVAYISMAHFQQLLHLYDLASLRSTLTTLTDALEAKLSEQGLGKIDILSIDLTTKE